VRVSRGALQQAVKLVIESLVRKKASKEKRETRRRERCARRRAERRCDATCFADNAPQTLTCLTSHRCHRNTIEKDFILLCYPHLISDSPSRWQERSEAAGQGCSERRLTSSGWRECYTAPSSPSPQATPVLRPAERASGEVASAR
jgi:hypothetical protein